MVSTNHNPFCGWSVSDITKIALSSTSTAGVAGVAAGSARLAPLAAGFGTGFAGGGGASVVNDTWVDGLPQSWATGRNAVVNGAGGGAGSTATEAVLLPRADRLTALVRPSTGPRLVAVRRPMLWVPEGGARHALLGVPVDGAVQGLVTVPLSSQPPPAPPLSPLPPTAPRYP